jgi:hypothetical protein
MIYHIFQPNEADRFHAKEKGLGFKRKLQDRNPHLLRTFPVGISSVTNQPPWCTSPQRNAYDGCLFRP